MRAFTALAATAALLTSTSAFAQAVSQPNGKIEVEGGTYANPIAGQYAVGASFAAPLGDQFGVQVDGALHNRGNALNRAAAIHLFTRDPETYLAGAAAAYVETDAAKLLTVGPEVEFYHDAITIEAFLGWGQIDYVSPFRTDATGLVALADFAVYATDNTRISFGGGTILGTETFNVTVEHSFADQSMPLSLTGKLGWDEGTGMRATVGFKSYFGEAGKSLVDRHRQDDPRNLGMDVFIGPLPAEAEPEDEPAPE